MKNALALLVLLLFVPGLAQSQTFKSYPLQSSGRQDDALSGQGSAAAVSGMSAIALTVRGNATSDCVVSFKGSETTDATAEYTSLTCQNFSGLTTATSVTVSGTTITRWLCPITGLKFFRAPVSSCSSTKTATVTGSAVPGVSAKAGTASGVTALDNPSATITSNSAQNGSAATAMRSDATPAISTSAVLQLGTLTTTRHISSVQALGVVTTTATVTVTAGDVVTLTTTASTNLSITPSGAGTSGQRMLILITSDATGGDVVTFSNTFKPSGTMTLVASRLHTIEFVSNGSAWYEVARTLGLG